MDDSQRPHGLALLARQLRELSVIVQSSHVALGEVVGDTDRTALARTKGLRLLAEFEQTVLMDGHNSAVIAAIATARRHLR